LNTQSLYFELPAHTCPIVANMRNREHRRARLRLPVRLRWTTPFGQKIDLCETLDASRSGLLVSCHEEHSPGVVLWVTFPYDSSLLEGQPEIPARVVRCRDSHDVLAVGSTFDTRNKISTSARARAKKLDEVIRELHLSDEPKTFAVALHFEEATQSPNGHSGESERRCSPRRSLALPVRLRLEHMPWFEEAMTLDVSEEGMRLRSNREYEPGANVFVSFETSGYSPWPSGGEFRSLVLRVEPLQENSSLAVALCRLQ
jgi:hypothetical protein